LNEVQQEHKLKHAETKDKSAPAIGRKFISSLSFFPLGLFEGNLRFEKLFLLQCLHFFFLTEENVKIKKIDRAGFLQEVQKGVELKHKE
jgi:hypothetical protein